MVKVKAIKRKPVKQRTKTSAPKPIVKVRYIEGVGRRKTSVARVRIFNQGGGDFSVNGKPMKEYFHLLDLQAIVFAPFERMGFTDKFSVSAKVQGGGFHSQAEAVRHGITRALVLFDPELRGGLKKLGFLTRDSRMRERKKFGLKRARRAPQWSKR